MICKDRDKITLEFFGQLLHRYQTGTKQSIDGSGFVLEHVDLLHYKSQKIGLRRSTSYIVLLNQKPIATKKSRNRDDNCFQYGLQVTLNHQNTSEKIKKLRPCIAKYNWEEINFPSEKRPVKVSDKQQINRSQCFVCAIQQRRKKKVRISKP